MTKEVNTSKILDSILNLFVGSGVVVTTIVAPNAIQALDKPLNGYFRAMNGRARERELKKHVRYLRTRGYLKEYAHGLQLTEKGRTRLQRAEIEDLKITQPKKWDHKWRIVLFDIPEAKKTGRDGLTRKLKEIGFFTLQKSVWLHPFPCREEIEQVASYYEIDRYVTFIETNYIDKQDLLIKQFKV